MYGIRGAALDWFRSYISGRYQYVALIDILFEPRVVSCGVSQGSILGPMLFLIFINDFPNSSQYFQFTLFADDSILTSHIPDESADCIKIIVANELQNISRWADSNNLVINAKKE